MVNLNVNLKDGKYSVEMKNGYVKIYDSNGNVIYFKDSYGFENWSEYDSNGNMIYRKYPSELEKWWEYDSNNNRIHYKSSTGYEEWWEYDSNGNCIHQKYSNGAELWYDVHGNRLTKEAYDQIYSSYHDKIVEIDGKKYQLKEINHG